MNKKIAKREGPLDAELIAKYNKDKQFDSNAALKKLTNAPGEFSNECTHSKHLKIKIALVYNRIV